MLVMVFVYARHLYSVYSTLNSGKELRTVCIIFRKPYRVRKIHHDYQKCIHK